METESSGRIFATRMGRGLTISAALLGALLVSSVSPQIEVMVVGEDEYDKEGRKIRNVLVFPGHRLSLQDTKELAKIDPSLLLNHYPPNEPPQRYMEEEIAEGGQHWKRKNKKRRRFR